MKEYYEAHITMIGDPAVIKPHVESIKWKFSQIDGDIVLGDGVKCYATRHFNAKLGDDAVKNQLMMAAGILDYPTGTVIRRKVERVIFDDRNADARTACDGKCPECIS